MAKLHTVSKMERISEWFYSLEKEDGEVNRVLPPAEIARDTDSIINHLACVFAADLEITDALLKVWTLIYDYREEKKNG